MIISDSEVELTNASKRTASLRNLKKYVHAVCNIDINTAHLDCLRVVYVSTSMKGLLVRSTVDQCCDVHFCVFD